MTLQHKPIQVKEESKDAEEQEEALQEEEGKGGKKKRQPSKKHKIQEIKDYLDFRYVFRRNVLTLEIEVRPVEKEEFAVLDEAFLNSVWIDLQMDGFNCSDNLLIKILNSKMTTSYNPVKDYFEQLPPYDEKEDYIEQLADTIEIEEIISGGIDLRKLWKVYLKKWLVASVATAIGKGTNHTCLILVGNQGAGKTTWLNKLCPEEMKEFLVCSHINPSLTDQQTANYLAEKWFVNIDDQLETIFGKDFNSMKAIITAPFVTNRKTWHRLTKTRPRIASFMGSVNNPRFLTDTENRRYLVFTTKKINFRHKVDIRKVWAQALHLLEEGFAYWFNYEEMKQLNKINEIYRQVPPEEEWLSKLFEPCKPSNPKAVFMMPSEILAKLNAWSGMKLSITKLSKAMDKLGFGQPISKRLDAGSPRKVYPVIERTDVEEFKLQQKLKENFRPPKPPRQLGL